MRLILTAIFFAISAQAVHGKEASVFTKLGPELGIQVSRYKYEEPGLMKISGEKLGAAGSYTTLLPKEFLFTVDGRVSYGALLYEGSSWESSEWGKLYHVPDLSAEGRVVIGKDFYTSTSGNFSLSPYFGAGYRYLFSNLSGVTTTNAAGSRRYSEYWYVPVGLKSRIKTGNRFVFVPTIEYDWFLHGRQRTRLTDTRRWSQDAVNKQNHGYGYRLSLMVENGSWSFGPWMHIWKVAESDLFPIGKIRVFEPKNKTKEIGFEARYLF